MSRQTDAVQRRGFVARRGVTPGRIGIDLGGTKIEGVVLDPDGSVVVRKRVPTERAGGYAHVVARVAALVSELCPLAPLAKHVGVGTPGSESARDGTLKNSNTTCLNGQPLRRDLEDAIGLPVALENDANCFALAEARHGAARGHRMVFGVILGTGVGGGLVLDGRPWTGAQHIAGEWGHHRIDPAGPDCYCGQRGCVETYLSGPALVRAYEAAGGESLGAPAVIERAAAGDPAATAALDGYLETFGRALANVVNVLDPDVIVLGGGLSNVPALYSRGREALARHVFNDELRTPVVRHALGDSAGVVGAALLDAPPRPGS
jgi:fructokinase